MPPRTSSSSSPPSSDVEIPGRFGTLAGFIVLFGTIISAMLIQYYGVDDFARPNWTNNCPDGEDLLCKQNGVILRTSFALCCVFFLQLLGTWLYTPFYDNFWGGKLLVFIGLLVTFEFLPAEVFDTHGFAWFGRIAAFLFLILQQIILLDMAYTWNEKWVSYSNEDSNGDERTSLWLYGLLGSSFILFSSSYTVIGLLFWQFDQCSNNAAILSLTLITTSVTTAVQLLFTTEGSLITSAVMTAYATYLCYAALVLNPLPHCNPTISSSTSNAYQDASQVCSHLVWYI